MRSELAKEINEYSRGGCGPTRPCAQYMPPGGVCGAAIVTAPRGIRRWQAAVRAARRPGRYAGTEWLRRVAASRAARPAEPAAAAVKTARTRKHFFSIPLTREL